MQVRTTAYTHTEAGGSRNAIGTRLRFGSETDSAAADWSWMPVGTRFRLVSTGRIYVIEDYGTALIGKKTIDLYMPNESMMRQWGVRTEEIEIIEWGSWAISKMLLSRGTAGNTVKRMLVALDNKANP
jgi:3D (Asp-Asp-Asp) domain-containing protein